MRRCSANAGSGGPRTRIHRATPYSPSTGAVGSRSGRNDGVAGEEPVDARGHLGAVQLDRSHQAGVGQLAGAVLEVEALDAEHGDGAGDPRRDRVGAPDVERAVLDVVLVLLAGQRGPAAFGADPVAPRLEGRVEDLPGLLVGLRDEARGLDADRQASEPELVSGAVEEVDVR